MRRESSTEQDKNNVKKDCSHRPSIPLFFYLIEDLERTRKRKNKTTQRSRVFCKKCKAQLFIAEPVKKRVHTAAEFTALFLALYLDDYIEKTVQGFHLFDHRISVILCTAVLTLIFCFLVWIVLSWTILHFCKWEEVDPDKNDTE